MLPFFFPPFFALCVYRIHPSPPVKLKYGLAFKKEPDTNQTHVCQTNRPLIDLVNSLLTWVNSLFYSSSILNITIRVFISPYHIFYFVLMLV